MDTSAWFASLVTWDADHTKATAWLKQNSESLLTTDYVVDETLTLLRSRGETARAFALGMAFFAGTLTTIHWLDEQQVRDAWGAFRRFADKEWSFTDCTSKVVIEQCGVSAAFAFDHHFRQFGTVPVVA